MSRYLNSKLLSKLIEGEFNNILNCVIGDTELCFEIRVKSEAVVYYKKSKILSLLPKRKEPKVLDKGYWMNGEEPLLDLQRPELYFELAKRLVDNFTSNRKNNLEFSIQQKILLDNNSDKNQFLVVDMEYQFAQDIIKERTKKKTRFDLLAVDIINNKVAILELKQGFASVKGNSGILDHKNRYNEHVNHSDFTKALISDIKSIIKQKEILGIYNFPTDKIVNNLNNVPIEFIVVFAYKDNKEKERYQNKYGKDKTTLFVDINDSSYILKRNEL